MYPFGRLVGSFLHDLVNEETLLVVILGSGVTVSDVAVEELVSRVVSRLVARLVEEEVVPVLKPSEVCVSESEVDFAVGFEVILGSEDVFEVLDDGSSPKDVDQPS
jgi:hypothetical protein